MATLVFGLDGANWPLIEPWIEAGLLPNIRQLRDDGVWGVSESVLPPVTCPNWKCYASSRSPGKHNVYWWEKVDRETLNIDVPDAQSFTAPELWDYLNDQDVDAGVMNLPMSYPPREIDQFMISGGPRSREEDYTYPPELEADIEQRFGYRVHPRNVVTSNQDQNGVDATLELIESRFETAEALLEERDIDFLHLTIFHLNVLQHYYWNGDPVKRAWELIDDRIGRFLDEGHTIFLMSDHGCEESHDVFHVNEWLNAEGYLSMNTTAADYLMKAGLTQERVAGIVRSFGLESRLRKYVPRRVVDRLPDNEGIKRDNKFDKLDTSESVAIASGQGLIYLLLNPGSTQYESVRSELIGKLEALETPRGTRVATAVHRGEDIYPDGDPRYRPDIVFEQGPGIHTSGAVGKGEIMAEPGRWAAENIRDGLFLAHGPTVEEQGDFGRISILDIAPSILYAMDLDIPDGFEGTPLPAVNANREGVTRRPSLPDRDAETADESEAVEKRLEDLGYLE
jgi:predicted AlkP superfamily phosphohydrolase/phosphomutase